MLGPTQNLISLGIMGSVRRAVTDKAHSVPGVLTPTACHIKRLIKFDSFICTYRIDKRGCSLKQMEGKGWGRVQEACVSVRVCWGVAVEGTGEEQGCMEAFSLRALLYTPGAGEGQEGGRREGLLGCSPTQRPWPRG